MALVVKNPLANAGDTGEAIPSLGGEDPPEAQLLTPGFLPGESHGQRRLMGYSPWGHKESDTTERLSMHSRTCACNSTMVCILGVTIRLQCEHWIGQRGRKEAKALLALSCTKGLGENF